MFGPEFPRTGKEILSQIHGEKCWPNVAKVSPCEDACPIHTDVPSYVMAIAQGKFKEALGVVRETNPFPSVCARVCHHPCEDACNRKFLDEPIAIQFLKRVAADQAGSAEDVPEPAKKRKERVAVVGSGPAGLTAAYGLARKGYGVTVYEAQPVAGGMLAFGIPQFVLPPEALESDLRYIRETGVEIRTGSPLGEALSLSDIKGRGYKAVLLATGAQSSAQLGVPGVSLRNVVAALPFLRDARMNGRRPLRGKVVVIGGGNVAMDAARTAVRLGASDVHLACLEARADMPAFAWEIENAEREGVRVHNLLAPQEFAPRGRRVAGVSFKRVASTSVDKEGRVSWTLAQGPGTEFGMEADAVVVAIGQVADPSYLNGARGVKTKSRGVFLVDPETMATSAKGIFAAGDAVCIPGTVTESIAAGHRAALSIDRSLRGEDLREGRNPPRPNVFLMTEQTPIPGFLTRKRRWTMPRLAAADSVRSFEEVALGYPMAIAVEEAKRCLNCRMCGNCVLDHDQLCLETSRRLL